jgi:hypothetical protein
MCALFLAAVDSGMAQTNTTPKTTNPTKSMTYTLDMDPSDGTKAVRNPTEADIRKAVASLRGDAEPGFLILRKDEANVIQVTCVAQDSFAIQSQEGDEQHQFQTTKNLSAKTTTNLLLAYRNDDANWKKLTDWKTM